MAIETQVDEAAYRRLTLAEPDHKWELVDGRLREKPGMSWEHGGVVASLSLLLQLQIDRLAFQVRINEGRVRRPDGGIYIPDLVVVPASLGREYRGRPGTLPIFDAPLPLIVEVWSPSTGEYDVGKKLADYQRRGDLEIWYAHPYERTLTAWRRQPDGSYEETVHRQGIVHVASLPGVRVDLDALFDA